MPHSTSPSSPFLSSQSLPSLSGDPDYAVPWDMQTAARYDKIHPSRRIGVAEAATCAVVSLLASPAVAPGGPWNPAVDYWRDEHIRKLVCRVHGGRWEEVQGIDGIITTQDGSVGWGQAAARAFVSEPVYPLPGTLAETQVKDTHFPPGDELPPSPAKITAHVTQDPAATEQTALMAASTSNGVLVTIEATPLHEITSGKLATQCGHAAQLAWESNVMPPILRQAWVGDGYRVCVAVPSREQWEATTQPTSVTDAGFTGLDDPTETAHIS